MISRVGRCGTCPQRNQLSARFLPRGRVQVHSLLYRHLKSDQADARAERTLYISWQIAHTKDQQVLKLENCIFVSPIKPLSPGIQEHGPIPIQPPPPVAVYPTVPPPPTLQTVPNPPPIAPTMPPPPPQHFMQGQVPAPVRPKGTKIRQIKS